MTAGGSSIPGVQALLSSFAYRRRCAEAGTAFGEGAAAMARTATSVVTVEVDPERAAVARDRLRDLPNVELLEGDWHKLLPPRAPFDLFFLDAGGIKQDPDEHLPDAVGLLALGGTLVLDDFTQSIPGDPAREALRAHPELVVTEHRLVGAGMSVIVATRVTAAASGT
jgi:predicted O-methyltransferase YrrM